ncbi:MAG: lactonase family protein, partial [Clostridiales bacterium]|nr:lactonase family protein [Clostridiales bacterium]
QADTGALKLLSRSRADVSVGQQCFDNDRMISYVVEELSSQHGCVGGGGYVWSFGLDPETLEFRELNHRPSLGSMPAYICIDKSKKYAVVVHHCLPKHITKLIQKEDGSYGTEVILEEGSVILFRLNEDGSIGEDCDAMTFKGSGKPGLDTFCHPHWVGCDPTGELYVVNDCGSDRIFTFHIDREKGKLLLLKEIYAGYGYWPRYSAFLSDAPIFYNSNEQKLVVQGYRYDVESGELEKVCEANMLSEEYQAGRTIHAEPSDIILHPSGHTLYTAVRDYNCIAVYHINEDYTLTLLQDIDCGGSYPRGICVTP